MANIFFVNVYQIDQKVLPRDQSQRWGFPTTGVTVQDTINSPQRSLSSGYNVYGCILLPTGARNNTDGLKQFYVQETVAQLTTLIG